MNLVVNLLIQCQIDKKYFLKGSKLSKNIPRVRAILYTKKD